MENLEQIDTEEYDEEDIDDTSQAINTILEENPKDALKINNCFK